MSENALTKNELEAMKIDAGTRKFERICDIVKLAIWWGAFTLIAIEFIRTFPELAKSKSAALRALAQVVESFHVDGVVLAVTNLITGCGWYRSHRRTLRLVKKDGDFRHEIEHNDAVNSRSGLREDGTGKGE